MESFQLPLAAELFPPSPAEIPPTKKRVPAFCVSLSAILQKTAGRSGSGFAIEELPADFAECAYLPG